MFTTPSTCLFQTFPLNNLVSFFSDWSREFITRVPLLNLKHPFRPFGPHRSTFSPWCFPYTTSSKTFRQRRYRSLFDPSNNPSTWSSVILLFWSGRPWITTEKIRKWSRLESLEVSYSSLTKLVRVTQKRFTPYIVSHPLTVTRGFTSKW